MDYTNFSRLTWSEFQNEIEQDESITLSENCASLVTYFSRHDF